MKIAYIVPGVGLDKEELKRRQEILRSLSYPGVIVDVITVDEGPYTIESNVEEEYAAVSYLGKLYEIRDNYDAFIIGCFGDPGLRAARELVSRPVIGPGEGSYMMASILARKFAVVTPLNSLIPSTWSQLDLYGYSGRVYDVVSADIKVADIQKSREALIKLLNERLRSIVGYGRAEAIVLGCMSMGFALIDNELSNTLGVPVINPVKVSLKLAEVFSFLGLAHSKLTYPTPELGKIKHLINK